MGEPDTLEVRELKAALERTVDELEEQRVAAIELRMLLDASEARLRTMGAELEEALVAAKDSEERREAARVEAIEMRVILDATEHRAAKLQEDLAAVTRERDALAADCDRLRAEMLHGQEERRTLEALLEEVSPKLDEAERVVAELAEVRAAAASQAAESAAELELRLVDLSAAQEEIARLGVEVERARGSAEQAEAQLAESRREVDELSRQVRDLQRRPAAAAPAAQPAAGLRLAAAPPAAPARDSSLDRLADEAAAAAEIAAMPEASPRDDGAVPMAGFTLVHLDDHAEYRDAIASAAQQFPGLRYLGGDALPGQPPGGRSLVVANLLAAGDPLGAIGAAAEWSGADPRAFTYCADGTRGVVLGTVAYFPDPFDPDACATRLLEEGVQRLLTVSDDIELTNEIRSTMAKFHCSTSVALDGRQASELAALVRPEFVAVDLGLPRGEALRVIARLRLDPKTAAIPVALLWNRHIEPSDLRVHAARVARDTLLAPEDLKRSMVSALSDRSRRAELLLETA